MEAWVCILWLNNRSITFDMQNEDAVVQMAIELTARVIPNDLLICISQFDGKVLYFRNGKQIGGPNE